MQIGPIEEPFEKDTNSRFSGFFVPNFWRKYRPTVFPLILFFFNNRIGELLAKKLAASIPVMAQQALMISKGRRDELALATMMMERPNRLESVRRERGRFVIICDMTLVDNIVLKDPLCLSAIDIHRNSIY
jgi:hypothetical protein